MGSTPMAIPPACSQCREHLGPPAPAFWLDGGKQDISIRMFSLKDCVFKGERGKRGRNGFAGPSGPSGSPGKEVTFYITPVSFEQQRDVWGGRLRAWHLGCVCFHRLGALGQESMEGHAKQIPPFYFVFLTLQGIPGTPGPKGSKVSANLPGRSQVAEILEWQWDSPLPSSGSLSLIPSSHFILLSPSCPSSQGLLEHPPERAAESQWT